MRRVLTLHLSNLRASRRSTPRPPLTIHVYYGARILIRETRDNRKDRT